MYSKADLLAAINLSKPSRNLEWHMIF